MSERNEYPDGMFSWVELVATDYAKAKPFYEGIFGWEWVDIPTGENTFYHMAYVDGKEVAAAYQMYPQQLEAGVPTHWGNYVNVDSVDDAIARAKEAGATVTVEPMDVMTAGRMAQFLDKEGAALNVWQKGDHVGAKLVNQHGAFCWNELNTRDPKGANEFYSAVFPWKPVIEDMGGMDYTIFMLGEAMNAGAFEMTAEMEGVPPHWAAYFAVDDCDATVEKAKELGGTVVMPPTDIPAGRFAVLTDPQGAVVSVIRLNPPA